MLRRLISILPLPAVALALLAPPLAAQPRSGPLPVELVAVSRQALTFDVSLVGTIVASDSFTLSFPQGGRVAQVLVQAGDRVRAGQLLARLDPIQQQQALAAARAALASAEAAEDQARQAANRAAEMLRRGVGTRADRDAAEQALSAAGGEAERARIAADQARRARDDTRLTAPQTAVVTQRSAEPGQIVGVAQPVLRLAALTGLEAEFQTPDRPQLDQAMGADVTLQSLDRPGLVLRATVTEIAPLVDPRTGAVTVRAVIGDQTDTALLGGAVRGSIHLPAGEGIAIPWTALTASGDGHAVWRVGADGRVALTPVEVERFQTGRVIVAGGVNPGDIVVGEGSQLMYPGRPVAAGEARR